MIKIDLITGFLGAGKTTFLLKYARHLMDKGLRIGILEYDYGAVNVDMLLLQELRGPKCELEMLAAACDRDCLERRFRTKLISMAMSGYDRVLIEPSGVFDMDLFFDALREEPLERWYEPGSVIAIVRADLPEALSPAEDFVLASQAADAGCILLSNTQNAAAGDCERTIAHVERAIEGIKCRNFKGNYVDKAWDALTEEDLTAIENSGYHVHDYVKMYNDDNAGFSSVCFLDLPDELDRVLQKAETLFGSEEYGHVLRVKGFACRDGVRYELNVTPEMMRAEPAREMTEAAPGLSRDVAAIELNGIRVTKNGQRVLTVIGSGLDEKKIRALMNTK